ncbi:hypothetical protein LOAG_03751 [Loa loa]|uniref:Uncharacterized protein n=1 Tax=Loa loa TaxID=7209 RepID=A0A1S0U3P8_LOALO|nr:hypothetical protein LOAG_03751 [Loa loa]EFO24737.1 hypothetical protein LOAG_03751 [Loa loa]
MAAFWQIANANSGTFWNNPDFRIMKHYGYMLKEPNSSDKGYQQFFTKYKTICHPVRDLLTWTNLIPVEQLKGKKINEPEYVLEVTLMAVLFYKTNRTKYYQSSIFFNHIIMPISSPDPLFSKIIVP